MNGQALVLPARRLPDDGLKAWALVQERGYEGLVAKDPRSPYDPQRTRWLTVKVRREGKFVIGGLIPELRSSGQPALLVGQPDARGLRFCGIVEFGVGRRLAEALMREPAVVRGKSPFHNVRRFGDAVWLERRLIAEVTYAEVVQGRLRDPVLRGLRGLRP